MARIVKKPQERRLEIVRASRELFLTKDYENTTIQDVMQKLNLAKGTTYYYFKSKADLLDAVVVDMVEELLTEIQAAMKQRQGTALDQMKVLFAAGQVKEKLLLNALHRPGNSLLHTQLLAVTLSKLAPLYADLIMQGCKEGLFHTDHPLECAEFAIAGIQFLTDIGVYPWSPDALMRRRRAFPKILEQLVEAPTGSFAFMSEEQ